ncbi:AAA family ATPase [Saccharothrix lopnurensis]|uniref:AAA family ATPase n=1 Tax=Saccharothrix lopnurensis TaxID=1670621 RepID=A0ABW1P9M2_9PSEU
MFGSTRNTITRSGKQQPGKMVIVDLSPGELLDPRYEVVPFRGRAAELRELDRWVDGGGSSVLLLHGPAGVGKTRLARRLAAGAPVRVVDDADLLPWRELHDLLREPDTHVLLLARTAGWWWSAARQRAADLGRTGAELALGPCPEQHAASFADACDRFADALDLPRPTAPAAPDPAAPDPAAPDPAVATYHDLHLSALAVVHGVRDPDRADLVRWLVSVDPAATDRGRLAEDVLAVALLDERIEPECTPETLEALLRAADRWPHVPRRAERLFAARPDLARTATAATLRAVAGLPAAAAAVARDVFDDARFHGDPLPAVLTRALLRDRDRDRHDDRDRHRDNDPDRHPHRDRAGGAGKSELAELHGVLSARAALAALREEALEATSLEVGLYRELTAADPVEHRSALADALGDLGLKLVAVGRDAEAVTAAEEAVELCRLAAAEDVDYAPRLVGALDQLSLRYAAVGRRDEALAAVAEAAVRCRDLAGHQHALFGLDLAKVTHHHAARLFDAGRREEAARTARLAVARWRSVAAGDPRFEADLARALLSVAALLTSCGLPEEAVAAVEESVAVLRRLARANPRDFEPELAGALGELAAAHRDRPVEAAAAADEVVLVRRRLARGGDPDAVARLAAALVARVDVAADGGAGVLERRSVAEAAVVLLRPSAVRHPAAVTAARAKVVGLLLAAGREREARRLAEEVLVAAGDLPHHVLVAQGPEPARALRALADELPETDELAARLVERAAATWRDLLGRHRAAATAFPEAVHRAAVLRRAQDHPGAADHARWAVLAWQLTGAPDELAAEARYADALLFRVRLCVEGNTDLDRALLLAHRAVEVLRAAGAPAEVCRGATAAVDDVLRAHADPEVARARPRASSW